MMRNQTLASSKRTFRIKNRLFSLDATLIKLCVCLFEWAKYRQTKGAVKLHLLLDHEGYLRVFDCITTGRVHEIPIARTLNFSAGSIVVGNPWHVDIELFRFWDQTGVFFVTRQKENAHYQIVEERAIPKNRHILRDDTIELLGHDTQQKYSEPLRRIELWGEENEQPIVLLTNHLEFGSTTIAAIYKDRWQIEIFFKTIKYSPKIKDLCGKFSQCAFDTDLDSIDRDPRSEVPEAPLPVQMFAVELGRDASIQPLYLPGLVGLDRSAL